MEMKTKIRHVIVSRVLSEDYLPNTRLKDLKVQTIHRTLFERCVFKKIVIWFRILCTLPWKRPSQEVNHRTIVLKVNIRFENVNFTPLSQSIECPVTDVRALSGMKLEISTLSSLCILEYNRFPILRLLFEWCR